MASNVVVVDSTFKQTRIKVTPAKPLREVLEEVCKSKNLDPDTHALKTQNNKILDLSQPFRLSGLSAGAKLQLTRTSRSAGVVTIALQLPESEGGGRLEDKFPSTTSLWLVCRKFEDAVAGQTQRKLNLTQRAIPSKQTSGSGRLEYEQPVLNLANRSFETFPDLQKTLAQLGINSGNVLIRLSFRNSGQSLEEAMQDINQYFESGDGASVGAASSTIQSTTQEPGNTRTPPEASLTSQADNLPGEALAHAHGEAGPESTSAEESSTSHAVGQEAFAPSSETQPRTADAARPSNIVNGISVFRPPSSSTPAAALASEDPSIFDPTIEDAKRHQASLQKAGRPARLLSDKQLEEQEQTRQARLALVQEVTLRVRYPDQSSIQLTTAASETAADLYGKIMGTLEAAPEPFELRYVNDKGQQILLPNSSSRLLVRDFGFRGRVTVTMSWSPEASLAARQKRCLKAEYWSKAQDLKVELQAQQVAGEENHRAAMAKKDSPAPGSGKAKGDVESKLKKFMGFGKK